MGDGVHLADVGQELVAQTLALRRALHQTGDINERHAGRDDGLGRGNGGQFVQAVIRHSHLAHIGLNRAERKVGGLRGGGLGQRVEQGRFAHIRQTHNSHLETHHDHPLRISAASSRTASRCKTATCDGKTDAQSQKQLIPPRRIVHDGPVAQQCAPVLNQTKQEQAHDPLSRCCICIMYCPFGTRPAQRSGVDLWPWDHGLWGRRHRQRGVRIGIQAHAFRPETGDVPVLGGQCLGLRRRGYLCGRRHLDALAMAKRLVHRQQHHAGPA
mmetsp:Transcript_23422/g.41090  ORF Transcript_23422/g.41090 Transcript_23422/m.41090 type:complete len:270 (-) Transcript_23422:5217-6026(-)